MDLDNFSVGNTSGSFSVGSRPQRRISVSPVFHPTTLSDLPLLSNGSVVFYTSSQTIFQASNNRFAGLIPPIPTGTNNRYDFVQVPESSEVLDIILHTIYNMSCTHMSPAFQSILTAARSLPHYGFASHTFISPTKPLFNLITSYAPLQPLDVYCLAASQDLYELAETTSSYLLSVQLSMLSDELAMEMGPVYLNRLFKLHASRTETLKSLLLSPPPLHPETDSCTFINQRRLTRFWTLAAASLVSDVRPDTSTRTIEIAFDPTKAEDVTCRDCLKRLENRARDIVRQWSLLKRTI